MSIFLCSLFLLCKEETEETPDRIHWAVQASPAPTPTVFPRLPIFCGKRFCPSCPTSTVFRPRQFSRNSRKVFPDLLPVCGKLPRKSGNFPSSGGFFGANPCFLPHTAPFSRKSRRFSPTGLPFVENLPPQNQNRTKKHTHRVFHPVGMFCGKFFWFFSCKKRTGAHRPMGAHLLASQAFSSSFRRGASVS